MPHVLIFHTYKFRSLDELFKYIMITEKFSSMPTENGEQN